MLTGHKMPPDQSLIVPKSLSSSRNTTRKLQQKWLIWERIKWFSVTHGFHVIILRLIGPQGRSKWLGAPGYATPWKKKPPFAQQIESKEQDSLAHILVLKQEESAPKTNSKPANLVPRTYHQYLKVFSKKESERMPIRKPWDHAIDSRKRSKQRKDDSYHFHLKNRRKYLTLLMINYQKGTSDLLL